MRPGLAILLCGAVLLVPLLFLRSATGVEAAPDRTSTGGAVATVPPSAHAQPSWKLASDTRRTRSRPPVTTTTTAPATTVPPTTVPPVPVPATTVPPTTTTTVAPTTTTTVPAPAVATAVSRGTGQVTYYDHPAGTCASPWLSFGTVVTITNPANGATVTCLVNDREADTARSIDLATATFAELAPLSQGVIDAELSW